MLSRNHAFPPAPSRHCQGECGQFVAELCPFGDEGCPDTDGDYDVVLPEPLNYETSEGYQIFVADAHDPSVFACSADFTLMASKQAPVVGDKNGPHLAVTSPAEGDAALAGNQYTVKVRAIKLPNNSR